MSGLHDALAAIEGVEGWLPSAQAARLWRAASRVPAGGAACEIGSFRGRSAIVLARALPPDVTLVCVDPHLGSDRGPQEIEADLDLGEQDVATFRANLERAGVLERVRHVRKLSAEALEDVPGELDLLYVDGAHRYGPALDDLVRWGAKVRPGGTMLVHDSWSSIGVTGALLRAVVFARGWRSAGRTGSLAEWRREPNGVASVAAQLAGTPWFARNVVLKGLIAAGLRGGPWPH